MNPILSKFTTLFITPLGELEMLYALLFGALLLAGERYCSARQRVGNIAKQALGREIWPVLL